MSCPGDTMFNVSCQGHQTLGLNKFPTLGFISPGGHHTKDLKNILDKMWLHEHFKYFLFQIQMKSDHPDIFISYCWQNSQEAVNNGTQARHGALGYGDPRKIKEFLEKKGLSCWLDIEQMGKVGGFQTNF